MAKLETVKIITDEAWLRDENAEVAVPFEFTVMVGRAECRVYPSAQDLTDEFLHTFGTTEETLLSRDAVVWLNERFDRFLAEYGFSLSPDSEDYYIGYILTDSCEAVMPEVCRLDGSENYTDLTDTDIDGLIECGYIIYAAVVDGKIVAVANTGEPVTEDTPREVEIGVDTAEKYRRRGYGSACVNALVRELERLGHIALYECASGNAASLKLAERLGGVSKYKKLYIVGFKDE